MTDRSEEKCNHDWEYEGSIMCSNPPKQNRVCRLCLKHEMITLGEYEAPSEYDFFMKKRKEESDGKKN
jgi:hypothetical protein